MRSFGLLMGALVLLAAPLGCSNSGVPVAKVKGRVTYNGNAVADASISFIPEKPGVVPGLGKTDKDGHYTLNTYGTGDGAPVGKCRVAISLTGPPPPLPEHLAKAEAAAETMQMPGKPLIPKRYFSPETSDLSVEVKPGSNEFNFELVGEILP